MRAVFGVLSLLVVVAIVGVLAKKQLSAGVAPRTSADGTTVTVPAANPQQQVQQYKQAVEGALQQQARPMPQDETK